MPGFVCKKRGIINGFEVALFELYDEVLANG
jgi:hypothetical protein